MRCAIRSDAVAGRSRDIVLVIPDATTRIMLLDFDTLPDKLEDAEGVVRFRLKKSLPFDVDQSAVSFDRQTAENGVRVIAAVTPRTRNRRVRIRGARGRLQPGHRNTLDDCRTRRGGCHPADAW